MAISQADRLEAYEALTSAIGRKAAGTIMNEVKESGEGILGLNHRLDLLHAQLLGMEKSITSTNNWMRALFAVFFAFDSAILLTLIQMR